MLRWFITEILPNLVADAMYGTPAFVVSHVLLRRHITRRTAAPAEHTTKETDADRV